MRARFGIALATVTMIAVAGCGSSPEATVGSSGAKVDTSGCSGLDLATDSGPFTVNAGRPPRKDCWNVGESGLVVSYAWTQENDATPEKNDVGFWVAINGSGVYDKADAYHCDEESSGGYGHPTDNDRVYLCTASKDFRFDAHPELLAAAYDDAGARRAWAVEVAASLDDAGTWDSRNGENYRFTF